MEKQYFELVDLAARIKEGVAELFPEKIWVKGEIREWSPRSNGHCYLTLSQSLSGKPLAEMRAMIWKWHYPAVKTFFEEASGETLRAGITVLVRAQVNYSELYGVSLFIDDIDPAFTLGEKAMERRRTLEKLTAEGMMDLQKELSLPRLPRRLAVISAPTAAGLGDFRNHLENNPDGYAFELVLFEALMQGEGAPPSIISAFNQIAEDGGFDAVLLLRGGGSESDLACFDDYDLAVAIATCEVPVITAIGHDKDVHVADLVASASVKTPTALAALFLDIYVAEDEEITMLATAVDLAVTRRIAAEENRLVSIRSRIYFAANSLYSREESAVALREALISAADPRAILSRGYVLVTGRDNKVLKTASRVGVGDRIGVRFADGSLTARVEDVSQTDNDNTTA
ncbi:MAG: exodeoxyribonuclease VII large subunit [Bacteroidales bacterium]|nr:exodeoxyribonuclease VII large subunit [Bacteroidales bacterium]